MPKTDREFVCTDCNQGFATAVEFSNHFKRGSGGIAIIGCNPRAEMKAEAKT